MNGSGALVSEMLDAHAEGCEDVGDDATVAPPPENLGAHDRRAKSAGDHHQIEESVRELLGRDVIGIPAKGGVSPS
jgi:hypothetical protein